MNSNRIKISLLHTVYHLTHSMETWVDLFWNSSLQMLVFGFLAVAFAKAQNPLYGTYMIAGLVFWNIIWSAQYGITVGVLWEIWSRSFSSLFITPLTLEEFLVGQAISGAIKGLASLLITAVIGAVVYKFSLLTFGWFLPIYFLELFLFGVSAGMFVLSLIFRWGTQVQSLSWAIVFLIQPFGAVFYPVTVLPEQIRWIAYLFPTTYVYETIRGQIANGSVNIPYLGIATLVNLVYFFVSYWFLRITHEASKRSGAFARLEG
jgi:ABC-2 type transport system permease protein